MKKQILLLLTCSIFFISCNQAIYRQPNTWAIPTAIMHQGATDENCFVFKEFDVQNDGEIRGSFILPKEREDIVQLHCFTNDIFTQNNSWSTKLEINIDLELYYDNKVIKNSLANPKSRIDQDGIGRFELEGIKSLPRMKEIKYKLTFKNAKYIEAKYKKYSKPISMNTNWFNEAEVMDMTDKVNKNKDDYPELWKCYFVVTDHQAQWLGGE